MFSLVFIILTHSFCVANITSHFSFSLKEKMIKEAAFEWHCHQGTLVVWCSWWWWKKRIYTTHLPHFQSTLKKQGKSFLSLCLHTMHACTHKQEVRQGYEYNLKTLKLIWLMKNVAIFHPVKERGIKVCLLLLFHSPWVRYNAQICNAQSASDFAISPSVTKSRSKILICILWWYSI